MFDDIPAKPKSNRGGRRPGAGAPRGNLNAVKHGLRSRRIQRAFLILALCPETVQGLRALKRADEQAYSKRFVQALAAANRAAQLDRTLAQSIEQLILDRAAEVSRRYDR